MKTALIAALTLALTTTLAVPAMARENPQDFPMPAAAFEQRVDARLSRARDRMEKHIAERNLTDAQAAEVRARFDSATTQIKAEVDKAVADGTVTLEEAKAVRAVARQLLHHRHHQESES